MKHFVSPKADPRHPRSVPHLASDRLGTDQQGLCENGRWEKAETTAQRHCRKRKSEKISCAGWHKRTPDTCWLQCLAVASRRSLKSGGFQEPCLSGNLIANMANNQRRREFHLETRNMEHYADPNAEQPFRAAHGRRSYMLKARGADP